MSKEEKVYISDHLFRKEVRYWILRAINDNDNPVKKVKSVTIATQILEVSKKVVRQELIVMEKNGWIVSDGNFWNITLNGLSVLNSQISNDDTEIYM